jgi:Transmembrane domain of unknown function (DUF3566)
LDRHTDRPGGSGGASPTVVTSLPGHDDLVDDEDITLDGEISANGAAKNGAAADVTAPRDVAVTTDYASQNGHDADGTAVAGSADYEIVPALPADSIGLPRGSQPKAAFTLDQDPADLDEPPAAAEDDHPMAFSFDRPVSTPVAPAFDDWAAADHGEPVGGDSDQANAAADPFSLPIDRAAFRAVSEQPAPGAAPPDMPAVSAAAFNWEMPDPPPTSPSSPARAYLRSAGSPPPPSPPPIPAPPIRPATTVPTRPPAPAPSPPRPATPATPKGSSQRSARQAHLTVARVEPWSVMKFSFVVSLVAFVVLFVAVSILYGSLSALGVFESLQRVVTSVTSSQNSAGENVSKWFSASKVLGYTALLGALNIVLITAMSTIGAVVYNLISRLVGGVEVTLRETE